MGISGNQVILQKGYVRISWDAWDSGGSGFPNIWGVPFGRGSDFLGYMSEPFSWKHSNLCVSYAHESDFFAFASYAPLILPGSGAYPVPPM